MQAAGLNVGGCLFLAELNYNLRISPAPAVPSLITPQTFNHRELENTTGTFSLA